MARVRSVMTVAAVVAGGTVLDARAASAAPHRPTYYFYGPGPTSTSCGSQGATCWYIKDGDRFPNNRRTIWVSQYGSTSLVQNADRARGYYKICEDHAFASDPCSTTAILTTSY